LTTLRRFERENPEITVLVNEKNQGAVAAVNRAVSHATGEFIFATAADDTVMPGFFEQSLAILNRYPQAGLCYAGRRSVTEDGELVRPHPNSTWAPATESSFIDPERVARLINSRGIFIFDTTNIYRAEVLDRFLPWSEALGPFISSYAAHAIALQRGVCFIPETFALRRVSDTQYAVHAMRDIQGALARTDTAIKMMETEYEGLWPQKFVKNYRQSEVRRIAHILQADRKVNQIETLGRIRALVGYKPTLLARLSVVELRASLSFSNAMYAMYIKWRFRPTVGAIFDRIKWKLGFDRQPG
jgi:glycosyltransferase involved in cell wall biosynthesis